MSQYVAYCVSSTNHEYCIINFSDTNNKAKLSALNDEWFEDDQYIDLRAHRAEWADHLEINELGEVSMCEHDEVFIKNGWNCYTVGECDNEECAFKKDSN